MEVIICYDHCEIFGQFLPGIVGRAGEVSKQSFIFGGKILRKENRCILFFYLYFFIKMSKNPLSL